MKSISAVAFVMLLVLSGCARQGGTPQEGPLPIVPDDVGNPGTPDSESLDIPVSDEELEALNESMEEAGKNETTHSINITAQDFGDLEDIDGESLDVGEPEDLSFE